jgi:hypothetical protein
MENCILLKQLKRIFIEYLQVKKKNRKPESYNKLSIHDDKADFRLSFTLCIWRVRSEINAPLKPLNDGRTC